MTSVRRRAIAVAIAVAVAGSMVLLAGPANAGGGGGGHGGGHRPDPVDQLTKAVTLQGALRHLDAFQRIANQNNGTRASGSPGFTASADYVARTLKRAGYKVTRQPFEFPFFEETDSSFAQVAPTPTEYVDGTDYDLMEYSGPATDVVGDVVAVDINLTPPRASTSGCEPEDFTPGLVTGKVALLQRGTCPFGDKVTNAEAAGAIGAIVMNQGNGTLEDNPDRYDLLLGTLGAPVGIPAVGVSFALGESFANTAGLRVEFNADVVSEIRSTENVIAESKWGDRSNVVMAGGHLDSVPAGPGINDNGSGSAALLEVAVQMAKFRTPNAVRFAWWGAEEGGLHGSNYYVANTTDEEFESIALYLNFDMIGSPNYIFAIYNGDDPNAPAGSAAIKETFEEFYTDRRQPFEDTDFDGRSDYFAFIQNGIPSGGLFTGAEEPKTAAQQAKYGGLAGVALDPCYHQACDSLNPVRDGADKAVYQQLNKRCSLYGNINRTAMDINTDAVASAVMTFAQSTAAVEAEQQTGAAAARVAAAPAAEVELVPAA